METFITSYVLAGLFCDMICMLGAYINNEELAIDEHLYAIILWPLLVIFCIWAASKGIK